MPRPRCHRAQGAPTVTVRDRRGHAPMREQLQHQVRGFHREERGQAAILFLLTISCMFMLSSLALEAGFCYFANRWAQNRAEAAALAAAGSLPASDTGPATTAANEWLE